MVNLQHITVIIHCIYYYFAMQAKKNRNKTETLSGKKMKEYVTHPQNKQTGKKL